MNLHGQFIEQIETLFPGDAKSLVDAIVGGDAVTSIRVNNAKTSMRPGIEDRVPWCEEGYYLPGHESFTFDPLFHAGLYYVQDASSMIISYIVKNPALVIPEPSRPGRIRLQPELICRISEQKA